MIGWARFGLVALLLLLAWLPAARASAACSIIGAGATQSIAVPGTGRSLLLHLPVGFDSARPAPLVFLFHGSGGSGARMLERSGLAATADRHGFILAVPDGGIPIEGGFVWNIPGVPTATGKIPGPQDADDVAFVRATVGWLKDQRCVDPARVYATGYSGGGRMASLLGCVAADRIAAIAPVVGLRAGIPLVGDPAQPDPASCTPSRPVPVITFAGDKDTENPIEGGGSSYWQYSMRAAEMRWAALNGCAPKPVLRRVSKAVSEERFTRCRGGAEVVARTVAGGEHVWLADNEALWAFLSRYRLR